MQQYINSYIKDCFYKIGDLECFGACLVRRNWVGGPHTQVDPLLAHLSRAPPMPGFLVDWTRSAPPELLLATPSVILYDANCISKYANIASDAVVCDDHDDMLCR
jgi:hypothetical protein